MIKVLTDPYYMIWVCLGLHLIADFVLQIQGMLHKFKSESWWGKQVKERVGILNNLSQSIIDDICNIGDNEKRIAMSKKWIEYTNNVNEAKDAAYKYKMDYMAGLVCHSTMWSVVTFFPFMFVVNSGCFSGVVVANLIVHAIVDHIKCNREAINLCTDQIIHAVQVVTTVYLCCKVFS